MTSPVGTQKNIPFFDYPDVFTQDAESLMETIADIGRRGAFILQADLATFERRLAEYVSVKHVVGVANATDGLLMVLRAAGVGVGDEVIFCSHTMVATAGAIHYSGATPVPVECGPDHLMDAVSAEAAITERTKIILPTHLNGRTCDMTPLRELAQRHGLDIVEDAAQGLGSQFDGQAAGTFGLAGAVSFYPAKTLGCLGDGGCVMTDDDEMYEKLLLLRDHGRNRAGEVVAWGGNSRLDNLQAAILNRKLDSYKQAIEYRRRLARLYQKRLNGISELRLPPGPDSDPKHFDIYQNYEIECDRRDDLRDHLSQAGVGTMIQWGGKGVHQLKTLGFDQQLPFTEALFKLLLLLPMNTSLDEEDVETICDHIRGFYDDQ